jgi:broad specificity phosphatase PhoE
MKNKAKTEGYHATWSDGVRDQDTELTAIGKLQALATGVELRGRFLVHDSPISIIYVSPHLRTRQTMKEIMTSLGYQMTVVVDERLREIEFGLLDGLTREGIEAKYPEEIKRKEREGKYYYRPPGGEIVQTWPFVSVPS